MEAVRQFGWSGFAIELGLGCALAAVLAAQAGAVAVSWGGGYWWFGALVGAIVGGLALVRRRQRLWTAVAGLAAAGVAVAAGWFAELPSEPGPAVALGLAVLLGGALRRLPVRQSLGLTVAALAVLLADVVPALPSVPASGSVAAVIMAAGAAVGLGLRAAAGRRRAAEEWTRRQERLELARELHDVVAHHVSAIVLRTQAARLAVRREPERGDEALAEIETAGCEALSAMRQVVGLLREHPAENGSGAGGFEPSRVGEPTANGSPHDQHPAASAGFGLPHAGGGATSDSTAADAEPSTAPEPLAQLVSRFAADGPAVDLRVDGEDCDWPPELALTVYRLVRESLTNVRRHAPGADTVTVHIAQTAATVTVDIADDAPVRAPRKPGGFGLVGMRERVAALGGTLSAGPGAERGWRVLATVPVRQRVSR